MEVALVADGLLNERKINTRVTTVQTNLSLGIFQEGLFKY